jgi:hypothetical protein
MKDVWLKYAVQILMGYVAQYLTPQKVEEGKVLLVKWLREQAKSSSSPFDDQFAEIFARALQVK